jgi:hypothetical protein
MNRFATPILALVLFGASSALGAEPTKDECIAANETGQDLRQAGELLEARTKLVPCVATSCPGPLREDCAQRLSEIATVMPTIVFEVKDGAGNDLSAVTVTIDGQPLAERLDGRPMAVDPGEHRFVFKGENGTTAEKTFVVREGDKERRERIVLGPTSVTTQSEPPVGERSTFALDRIPTVAYVAAGVGVVGLAIGIGTGIAATSKHSALEGEGCPSNGGTCPPTASQSDLDYFHSLRTASTVGYVIGAAGLVGGITLWLTMPKASANTSAVRVWLGPASAGLAGTF